MQSNRKYFNSRVKLIARRIKYKEIHYRLLIRLLSDIRFILKGSLREVEHAQTLFHIQECSVQSYDNS